jgi:hypothetical protein
VTVTISVPLAAYVTLHKRRLETTFPLEAAPPRQISSTLHNWCDTYSATVPRRWLNKKNQAEDETLAEAFWTSWPVHLEDMLLTRLVAPHRLRLCSFDDLASCSTASFEPNTALLSSRIFKVTRLPIHDESFANPVLCTYETTSGALKGGCHVLAVENLPQDKTLVRLWFCSFASIDYSKATWFSSNVALPMHQFYSRVLMDCAVRRLQRDAGLTGVKKKR